MMTKELHDKLNKYKQIFRTAIDGNYYRAMDSRFAEDFIQGCREMNIYINTGCGACVLRALKTLGKLYFEYQEPEGELPDNLLPPVIPTELDDKPIKPKKKVNQATSKNKKK